MILGRNPALWLALAATALNTAVVVFGIHLTAEQVAAINALLVAIIGLVANESDRSAVPTFAPTLTDRRTGPDVTVHEGDATVYAGPEKRKGEGP